MIKVMLICNLLDYILFVIFFVKMIGSRLRSISSRSKQPINKILTKNQPLEIIPPEIVFKDIEVNQYYEITVEIRNLTQNATRIRIPQPKNPNFKVIYSMQPQIAPGLSIVAKVKYECKELKNQIQMLKIVSDEGFVVQFPIKVYKMESQILFEPFVNMGFLKIGREHEEIISIKNSGKALGTIEFSHNHGSLISVEPKLLKIAPRQQSKIFVKYKPIQAGLFKGVIHLKSDSILVKQQIDLHATSVDFSRFVIDGKGNQTFSFDFGTLFVGEQNIIRGFLVNNSPKKMKFKSFFRKGFLTAPQQFALIQTPSQIGTEQSQRVMFLQPQVGEIEPFKQFEIKLICKTRINYRDRIFTKNYALTTQSEEAAISQMKNSNDFKPENIYEYSVMLNIEEDEPMILQLKTNAICPQIKVSNNIFKFGDCFCKQIKEIEFQVSNKNSGSKAEINFPKIPNFSVVPGQYTLRPNEKHKFTLVFEPKTIGKVDTSQMLLINKLYEIELRCFGISTSGTSKSRIKQEPINSKDISIKKMQPIKTRGKAFSLVDKTFMCQMRKSTQQQEQMKAEFTLNTENKQKFNQYLIDRRNERSGQEKKQQVKKRWTVYQSKLKDLGIASKLEEKIDDQGLPQNPPIDYEFETGMQETKISKQNVPIPQSKEKLFVTRHIADYEPIPITSSTTDRYSKNIEEGPKKIWPSDPSNFTHKRQVTNQLTAEELSQIQVSTNTISFGEIYIKSSTSRYFWIRNSTKKTISIQMIFKDTELNNSFKKPQIIPSCMEAAFQIVFFKDTLGDFRGSAKYIINNQHEFEMMITAKSVPVVIDSNKTNVKFMYEQQSLEMTTSETIKLTNPGNSDASFKFSLTKEPLFLPTVLDGKIQPKQTIQIPIFFTPPPTKTQKNEYSFHERLVIKVLDGAEIIIACNCHLPDPKYTIKPFTINNPVLCAGHEFNDVFEIKNISKYPIVFHISGKVIDIAEKVKINPEQIKKFSVRFKSEEVGVFDAEVCIQPRCGLSKTLYTSVKIVHPHLTFSREEIDMGMLVVQGVGGNQHFTITNNNQIQMPLLIDLRPRSVKESNPRYIENVNIKLLDAEQNLDVVAPTIRTDVDNRAPIQGQNLVDMEINEDELDNSEEDEEEIVERNEDQYRRFRLMLQPGKVYEFQVEFYPKQVGKYEIQVPLSIEGSKVSIDNGPILFCEGIKPQFIFQPSVIDFKKKIVTKPERSYPKFIQVTVSNLDSQECTWELHDQEVRKQGIFSFEKNQGTLKPQQSMELRASFNPYTVGEFSYKLPLFLYNKSLAEPLKYVDVIVKGTASLPNLFFNKRQVIMPVVPLNVETSSSFRIINDGYENCNLKCQFMDDVAGLDVRVLFPEGQNIGITRQKLKVDLTWKYHKPISFCLKLEFIDDLNRTFVIPISGTADNCILTNYTYFLRNEHKFVIKTEGQLQLIENIPDPTNHQPGLQRKHSSHSLRSNVTGRSVVSYLGVNPISPAILSNTIDYINRYLNSNMLTTTIREFPGSFIESDGQQIFQVMSFVSNKNPNYTWRYQPIANQKLIHRVYRLYHQYNELIKMLKIEGAHLNHIRPEYLLSFGDLNVYLSNLPPEKSEFYIPSLLKINSGLYNYLSLESWITLLYQIFKIYILARVTARNYKSHLTNSHEIPRYYLDQSNFISNHESILLFWVQQAILQVLLEEKRITNFDRDFKDGVAIGALLQKYAGVNVLKRMKMVCVNQEECRENAQIICEGLAEIGLQNHISVKDICNPLQRQMLMFILHLYVYLPFYLPKQDPVVFKCILGEEVIRTIQLTNPSSKPVTYMVKYEGSEDFQLLGDLKFKIQARQSFKYQVKFVSRVSSQVKGKIMFINVKQNSLTAAALVFQLKSEIIGRTSDRIWNISGILYEQVQFPIEVYNKFTNAEIVDFSISYQTQYLFDSKKSGKTLPLPLQQQMQTIYGKHENIKIRKNGTVNLILNYIPTSLYATKTTIFFLNPIIGEFQHEIIGSVEPPAPISEIRPPMPLSVDQVVNWEYALNPKNDQLARAKKGIDSLRKKKNSKENQKIFESTVNENFLIEIAPNPYITAKQSIFVTQKAKEDRKTSKQNVLVEQENKVPFTIVCKNPVYEFSTFVMLYNKTKNDIRRYKVVFTVQPKPLRAILEMNVPARNQITQNLPIVNNTERDWSIKVSWQPDFNKNGNYFYVPSQYSGTFPVKRNSIGNFPITFRPKWAFEAQAKLTLNNPLTLDHFEYQILGHGEEPLAEEHLQIKCQAKEVIKKEIYVKNPHSEKPVTFRIETDLMNCEAPKKLTIPSGGKEKFEFSVQPMLCGEYTGSITFFEEDGPQYVWYTVSVVTNYPEAYKVIEIQTEIRKKTLQEIHVPNDHTEQTSFQVVINGVGLIGDPTFTMKPSYDNTYILEYLPLEVGEEKGSICFINPQVGEVLFQLNLTCHEKPPVIINNLKSPLGVSTKVYAQLENPIFSKAIVKVQNSNPEQFVLKSQVIRLEPQEKKEVQIQYVPASLDTVESAKIIFSSKDIGDWLYDLSGTGQMPIPFNTYTVYNGLFEEHSDSIKFKNPFKYQIVVGVKMVEESEPNIFKLLSHGKTKFTLDTNGILQIPFSFIPNACKMYTCKVLVLLSEKIYWTFPIHGVTEVNEGKVIASLTTPCRQSTAQFVQIALEGVPFNSKNNSFNYSFENVPAQFAKLVDKFLIVDCAKNSLKHAKDTLEYEFIFKPMKPGKVSFDFLITKQEGSRWRYKIILEGTDPEVDDIIEIQSNLLMTSTVNFKITNTDKTGTPFRARFTSDSAHQFSIQPKEGILAPFGTKGSNFFVSYTPVEYGKEKKGKLIIETAEMFWSYLLKGSLPKYQPPRLQGRSRITSGDRK